MNARPAAVEVAVRRGSRTIHWRVPLPAKWPPSDASALVVRAENVWRSLHSVSFKEQLASDSRPPLESAWRIEAPNRVAYQVKAGWAGVVIGARRWDRPPGAARWVASAQTPLSQPVPTWAGAVDAHVLGTGTIKGRPVWRISFFDPGIPGWFEIALERSTLRTLETHMIAASHFMLDVYSLQRLAGNHAASSVSTPRSARFANCRVEVDEAREGLPRLDGSSGGCRRRAGPLAGSRSARLFPAPTASPGHISI